MRLGNGTVLESLKIVDAYEAANLGLSAPGSPRWVIASAWSFDHTKWTLAGPAPSSGDAEANPLGWLSAEGALRRLSTVLDSAHLGWPPDGRIDGVGWSELGRWMRTTEYQPDRMTVLRAGVIEDETWLDPESDLRDAESDLHEALTHCSIYLLPCLDPMPSA